MKLAIVIGSTRQNRQTFKVAKWVENMAEKIDGIESKLIDLTDYPMPFFAEPISPRYNPNRVVDLDIQKWLDIITEFEAYIFVTPEYNHSVPAVLKNALDYVAMEFNRKPAAIVSHGSVGGARATMQLKEILSESKLIVIPNSVALIGAHDNLDNEGILKEELKVLPYGPEYALKTMFEELKWYSDALGAAR